MGNNILVISGFSNRKRQKEGGVKENGETWSYQCQVGYWLLSDIVRLPQITIFMFSLIGQYPLSRHHYWFCRLYLRHYTSGNCVGTVSAFSSWSVSDLLGRFNWFQELYNSKSFSHKLSSPQNLKTPDSLHPTAKTQVSSINPSIHNTWSRYIFHIFTTYDASILISAQTT